MRDIYTQRRSEQPVVMDVLPPLPPGARCVCSLSSCRGFSIPTFQLLTLVNCRRILPAHAYTLSCSQSFRQETIPAIMYKCAIGRCRTHEKYFSEVDLSTYAAYPLNHRGRRLCSTFLETLSLSPKAIDQEGLSPRRTDHGYFLSLTSVCYHKTREITNATTAH